MTEDQIEWVRRETALHNARWGEFLNCQGTICREQEYRRRLCAATTEGGTTNEYSVFVLKGYRLDIMEALINGYRNPRLDARLPKE